MSASHEVQLSPIQLKQLIFTKIRVELSDGLEKTSELWAPNFKMDGVQIFNEITIAKPEDQIGDPKNFMMTMRLAILNEAEGCKKAPYTIDLVAQAWLETALQNDPAQREDMVRVNGASLILGAMRELVIQLTARSGFGPLMLPTLRFMPSLKDQESK